MHRSAAISACGRYRYRLDREWDPERGRIYVCLINPSTADASEDDATLRGLVARSKKLGFGSVAVWNAFAIRSSNPADIYAADDPVGPQNDEYTKAILSECRERNAQCLVGWSRHGKHLARADWIVSTANTLGVSLSCLAVNADGSPRHPLYVKHDAPLIRWLGQTDTG